MTVNRRRFLSLASVALAAPALSRTAFAADWPKDRIIRAIVPFSAGSPSTFIGRIVTDPLAQALGQTIVIENRGGAGGTIGSAAAAKAEPDGYTLLINAAAHTAAPAAYPDIAYDPATDFSGVAMFGIVPNVLLIAPSKGIKTIEEFVARGQGRADDLSPPPASAAPRTGRPSASALSAGFPGDARAVPRRAGGAHRSDDRPRRLHAASASLVRPALHPGRPALAARGRRREALAALPDVPTTLELATRIPTTISGTVCWCRRKTPRPIIDRLMARSPRRWRCRRCRRNWRCRASSPADDAGRVRRNDAPRDRHQLRSPRRRG